MVSGSVVFYKIATTCLIILVGYIVRRMHLLPENSVSVISKFILYVAYPTYFIFNISGTVSIEKLGHDWYFPLLAGFLIMVSDIFGWLSAKLWAGPGELATFRILVALPNWVFMAMAVCEPIFGLDGVRVVMLYNVGIMFYQWSFGMTSFRPGVGWKEVLRQLFLNMQIISIAIGFVLGLACPMLKGMERLSSAELAALPFYLGIVTPFWETFALLGGTALPLSIFQIGLMLGQPKTEAELAAPSGGNRSLIISSLLRLIVAPFISVAVLVLTKWAGIPLTFNEFVISVIIMSMPAAVLGLTVSDVYNGTVRLAARGILWGTLASLITAPIMTWVAQKAFALF